MLFVEEEDNQFRNVQFPIVNYTALPAQLWSIGHVTKRRPFSIDCSTRPPMEWGKYTFHYTVSGECMLENHQEHIRVREGEGFLVNFPSAWRFTIPLHCNHWEVIHITMYGNEVQRAWNQTIQTLGRSFRMNQDAPAIKLLQYAVQMAKGDMIHDPLSASAIAYQFVTELLRMCFNLDKSSSEYPHAVTRSLDYIRTNFAHDLSLDDIADASGLSKFHFSRQFLQNVGIPPLKYLTKLRIEQAIEMMMHTDTPIYEISRRVGFQNANYFSRVFGQYNQVTPSEFRRYARATNGGGE